jgi:hypothetical protein
VREWNWGRKCNEVVGSMEGMDCERIGGTVRWREEVESER